MANIERIKTDVDKETTGVWVDYVLGIRLKIGRAKNAKFQELLRDLIEPNKKKIREDKLDFVDFSKLMVKAHARTILLGWENIEDKDGKPIQYSAKQAEKFLSDPELKDFYEFVVAISENADQYAKEVLEESAKN